MARPALWAKYNDGLIYIYCAVCKKIFHTNTEWHGKIIGGGLWKCDECLKVPEVIKKNGVYHSNPKHIARIPLDDETFKEWKKRKLEQNTKYKVLGSPEIYAVHYHDTGHVIKTAEQKEELEITWANEEEKFETTCSIRNHENCTKPKFPLNDLREADSKGKFVPVRKSNRQLR